MTTTWSGVIGRAQRSDSCAATTARRRATPVVALYWAFAGSRSACAAAAAIRSRGSRSAAGSPPARLSTSGRAVRVSRSRMAEPRTACSRVENVIMRAPVVRTGGARPGSAGRKRSGVSDALDGAAAFRLLVSRFPGAGISDGRAHPDRARRHARPHRAQFDRTPRSESSYAPSTSAYASNVVGSAMSTIQYCGMPASAYSANLRTRSIRREPSERISTASIDRPTRGSAVGFCSYRAVVVTTTSGTRMVKQSSAEDDLDIVESAMSSSGNCSSRRYPRRRLTALLMPRQRFRPDREQPLPRAPGGRPRPRARPPTPPGSTGGPARRMPQSRSPPESRRWSHVAPTNPVLAGWAV